MPAPLLLLPSPKAPAAGIRLAWGIWLVVAGMSCCYWVLKRDGLYGLDDYLYARYAHQLATGTYHLPFDPQHLLHDPLRHRWAVFGPVALLFRLGGVSLATATLWPLLATLGTTALLTGLLAPRAPLAAAGATLVLGLSQHTLWLATYLYGDNVAMLLTLAAVAVPVAYRQRGGRHPLAWGTAFALTNLLAWLAKETVIWYLPAYAWLALLDWRTRTHGRFWYAASLVGAVLLTAYFGVYARYAADPWQRFHEIATTNEFLRSGSFGSQSWRALLARLSWQPATMLAASGLGVVVWPALLAAIQPGWRGRLLLRGPHATEGWWLVLVLAGGVHWWLGSTSLHFWNPVALNPRFLTPLLPPLAALAGLALAAWHRGTIGGAAVGIGFLGLALLAHNTVSALYLVLGGLAWWFGAGRRRLRPAQRWVAVGLLVVLAVRPAHQLTKASASDWQAQQALLLLPELVATAGATVFTDPHLRATYTFWYGFRAPSPLHWRPFGNGADSLPAAQPAYLLLNEATLHNPDMPVMAATPPARVRALFPGARLVARRNRVWFYEVSPPPCATAPRSPLPPPAPGR